MRKAFWLVAALILTLLPLSAAAQSVQQSGSVTVGRAAYWISNGVIGGSASGSNDSAITSLGVTSNMTTGFCVSSGRSSAAGRQQLCMGAPLSSAAVISLQNYGSATAQDLSFVVNGTTVTIPTGGGGTMPTLTLPLVANQPVCGNNSTGDLKGCSVGATNAIPYWSSSTVQSVISAAASSVLVTDGSNVPSLSQTLPAAVQSNITSLGTIASGTWNGTAIGIPYGGTGVSTLTANGVMIGNGTGAIQFASTASVGLCLLSNGSGTAPSFQSCAAGAGSAGGSNTQVQFNSSSSLAGSANLTWVSPALTIGVNASATGQLVLANGGALGTSVTIQNNSATSAYNFNLPATSGSSGQPLLSAGGGSSPMTFGTLGTAAGGTNCASPSGTCLDNITGFSSTGYINRTGAGTYAFSSTIGLINGGTGANLTASDGGIVYSTSSALAILSGTATAGQIVRSGSSTTPTWSTATYPATIGASELLYGSSANVIGGLTTANNGVLATNGSGVPSIASTLPSAVQGNITSVGTITSGVWTGTDIALADGGTGASLTANTGGIVYSGASALAILSGTATASFPLLSGSTAAPTWATITYPGSATSGGIAYFSSATAMASSAAMGSGQIVLGGGAGAAPTTSANASISAGALTLGQTGSVLGSIVLSGSTSGTVTIKAAAAAGTATNFQLPATNGTNTQVLSTDGSGNTSWVDSAGGGTVTSVAAGTGMSFSTITASGSVAIDKATAGNLAAGTSNKTLTADIAVAATAFSALSAGATVTPDLDTAYNFTLTPDQNFTLANPSNITGKLGRSFCIVITNDATPRTITLGTSYYAPGGASTIALTASNGAIDQLCGLIVTTTQINVTITKNYSH